MLKLEDVILFGSHVSDVPFAVFRAVPDLLALDRKIVFPRAMPFRFIFPPVIALTF